MSTELKPFLVRLTPSSVELLDKAAKEQEKPEIEIIKSLIKQLDDAREPMNVELDGDNVTVSKGNTTMKTTGKKRGK